MSNLVIQIYGFKLTFFCQNSDSVWKKIVVTCTCKYWFTVWAVRSFHYTDLSNSCNFCLITSRRTPFTLPKILNVTVAAEAWSWQQQAVYFKKSSIYNAAENGLIAPLCRLMQEALGWSHCCKLSCIWPRSYLRSRSESWDLRPIVGMATVALERSRLSNSVSSPSLDVTLSTGCSISVTPPKVTTLLWPRRAFAAPLKGLLQFLCRQAWHTRAGLSSLQTQPHKWRQAHKQTHTVANSPHSRWKSKKKKQGGK